MIAPVPLYFCVYDQKMSMQTVLWRLRKSLADFFTEIWVIQGFCSTGLCCP
jgi:hypothetical protein